MRGAKRILVVDDDLAQRMVWKHSLEDRGYEVVIADGVKAGVAALGKRDFDMVLTSKQLSGEKDAGFKMAEAARLFAGMPIVLMSTSVTALTRPLVEKRLSAIGGAIRFLDKFTPNAVDSVEKFLNNPVDLPSLP